MPRKKKVNALVDAATAIKGLSLDEAVAARQAWAETNPNIATEWNRTKPGDVSPPCPDAPMWAAGWPSTVANRAHSIMQRGGFYRSAQAWLAEVQFVAKGAGVSVDWVRLAEASDVEFIAAMQGYEAYARALRMVRDWKSHLRFVGED